MIVVRDNQQFPVVPLQQKCLEDLHSKVQRSCSKAVEEDEAALQKLQETLKSFASKASSLKREGDVSAWGDRFRDGGCIVRAFSLPPQL